MTSPASSLSNTPRSEDSKGIVILLLLLLLLLLIAPHKVNRGSTHGSTYYRSIHESKDVLKVIHMLSSVVVSCRHELAKVKSIIIIINYYYY